MLGGTFALQRQQVFCLPQKPIYDPIHLATVGTAIGSRLAHLEDGLGSPCRGSEDRFALLLQSRKANLRRGKVRED